MSKFEASSGLFQLKTLVFCQLVISVEHFLLFNITSYYVMKNIHLFVFFLTCMRPSKSAPLVNSDACNTPGVVARKFFVLDQFIFLTDNAEHFENYRILNVSSGAITTPHHVADFTGQTTRGLLWAFMFDVADGRCASEQFNSPYCTRVRSLQGLVVARDDRRQLVFMRLKGSGNGASLSAAHDSSSNFIEMQVLVRHLDKLGYVSSLTFAQKTDQFVSTHYGRLGQVCVTSIRHQEQLVPLPFSDEILNDDIFTTECLNNSNLPLPQPYNSVIDLHGQLFGITSGGTVDRMEVSGKHFKVVQTLTDKAFLNCSNLVRSRNFEDSPAKSSNESSTVSIILTAVVIAAVGILGFLCYVGKVNGAIDASNEEDKQAGNSSKTRSSKVNAKSKAFRKATRSESASGKASKSVMQKQLTVASNGIAQTIKSLRVLGRQLGDRFVQWKTLAAPGKLSTQSDATSNCVLSSVSVTPLTDDTENGGVELVTSTTIAQSQSDNVSLSSSLQSSAVSSTSKSNLSLVGNPGDDGNTRQSMNEKKSKAAQQEFSGLLTTTTSSYLSTENEFIASSRSFFRRGRAHPSSGQKASAKLPTAPEEPTLSQAISNMLEQYRQTNKAIRQIDSKSPSTSPSSSPSLPRLLTPEQFSKLTGCRDLSKQDESDLATESQMSLIEASDA